MAIYNVASDGEKGWTEISANTAKDAAIIFQQYTGLKAAQVIEKPSGWGNWGK